MLDPINEIHPILLEFRFPSLILDPREAPLMISCTFHSYPCPGNQTDEDPRPPSCLSIILMSIFA